MPDLPTDSEGYPIPLDAESQRILQVALGDPLTHAILEQFPGSRIVPARPAIATEPADDSDQATSGGAA